MNLVNNVQTLIGNKGTLIYLTHFGSKLYGTNTPTSDTDLKGIYLPSIESILLDEVESSIVYTSGTTLEKNTTTDIDITVYSLQYFLALLKSGEVGSIDLLFSMFQPTTILYEYTNIIQDLRLNYRKLISKKSKAFVGYCFNQAAKYGIKGSRYGDLLAVDEFLSTLSNLDEPIASITNSLPQLKYVFFMRHNDLEYLSILGKLHQSNITIDTLRKRITTELSKFGNRAKTASAAGGVDWKALSHAYRVIHQFNELAQTNMITFPLACADKLISIKQCTDIGQLPIILDDLTVQLDLVDYLITNSTLPDDVDSNYIRQLILRSYQ